MHTVPPNRLGELLKKRGLKLVDIAALCRVDQSTVYRWQQGIIPQKHLGAVAEKLGVSVPYLAGWSDPDDGDDSPAKAVA